MIIGSCKIELILPMAGSLKEKRSIIKSMLHKSKNKFNVAAAEVGKNDLWKNAVIGFVTVSNDRVYIDRLMSKIINFVEGFNEVEIIDSTIEIF